MELQVLDVDQMPIRSEEDITRVRRRVKTIATERGFDAFATAAITTATSELTRNALTHGGGGDVRIEELTDGARFGLRLTFVDEGPGIDDVDRALQGGFSTANSLGLGLSGTRRLVDEFALESEPRAGTRVVVCKWTRF